KPTENEGEGGTSQDRCQSVQRMVPDHLEGYVARRPDLAHAPHEEDFRKKDRRKQSDGRHQQTHEREESQADPPRRRDGPEVAQARPERRKQSECPEEQCEPAHFCLRSANSRASSISSA